ncbi:hypothetical protein EGI22_13060 [Lacihabitans sp. LS3-19]|uniref:type IX secretion system sortase PorU n=1 Tax=Lacihabitans sp. LS3-19 TaxID=2487335 RepID=UPI0020CB7DB8|nr:type IX secretion system sortase PorU [Lacihabitans sp. LS3-19]MCP9768849.1 hypothetical protein [Lacihabitans sp. LS3-19]
MRILTLLITLYSISLYGQKSVLFEGNWIRVAVKTSGVYKIDQAFLKKNGVNSKTIDPQNISVFVGNIETLPQKNSVNRISDLIEIPVLCTDSDHKFDNNDQITFYGASSHKVSFDSVTNTISHSINPYSDQNFYYINLGSKSSKKITSITAPNNTTSFSNNALFYYYHEKEDKNLLASGRQWFGDFFYNTLSFDIETPDAVSDISLNLQMLGIGQSEQVLDLKNEGNSIAKIALPSSNYNPSDNYARYNRISNCTNLFLNFPSTNPTFRLNMSLSTEGSANAGAYVDYFEIQYLRKIKYDNKNQLLFWKQNPDKKPLNIANFDKNTQIWDIFNPYNPCILEINEDGYFGTSNFNKNPFLVVNKDDFPNPIFVEKIKNQSIKNNISPEMLVVFPEKFRPEAERFIINKKQTQNLEVLGLSTQEIYNEMSSGKVDPSAIRDICKYFWNIDRSKFQYLLLFGDATFDYKNNNQISYIETKNLVPTYQSAESLEPIYSFASDDFFGFLEDFEGDWEEGVSQNNVWISNRKNDHTLDISVGRLPVKSLFEAKNMVNKIINYQNDIIKNGDWRNKLSFVADNRDYNIHQQNAEAMSKLAQNAFGGLEIDKIYLDQYPIISNGNALNAPAASFALNKTINEGSFLINYNGHGSEDGWAQEKLLTISDIQNFRNGTRLPIFFTATCQFGKFDNPALVSGAELSLLNPSGGCVALLTTTRPVYSSTNEKINRAFYNNLGKVKTLGELFLLTKNQAIEGEINRNFSLLGDPSILLPNYQNTISLTHINNQIPGNTVWKALEKIEFRGESSKIKNGKIQIKIFDKTEKIQTLGTYTDGPKFEYSSPSSKLYEGIFNLTNGIFEGSLILPKDQISGIGKALISFYATDTDSTENAFGYFDQFIISSETTENLDNEGPEVEISIDSDQYLTFNVYDPSGINISEFNQEHFIKIIIDDSTIVVANNFFNPYDGSVQGNLTYYVGNLASGKHTLKFIVFDNYNNVTEKPFDFNIEKQRFSIENFLNYPNPFSNYTNLIFKHNRLGDNLLAHLMIYDTFGRTVVDLQKSCEKCEGKIEFGLDFEGKTNMASQLFFKLELLSKSENESTQASGRLLFWK